MVNCELCGKRTDELTYSFVEGVKLQVCVNCAKYGKFAGSVKKVVYDGDSDNKNKFRKKAEEAEDAVVEDFSKIVRAKREEMGLSQKDFAMRLAERESFVARVEAGFTPNIETAKKIEKILGVKLVEKSKEVHVAGNAKAGALTIGDLIKRK